ncbi:hypothetical protein LZ198_00230 [Myxococcus sp. K15C18031901]|uniref:hypothetical protein n=1 Tax=Myxococcus dinghuensis TaxID=2906761 RepID=UPI0020A80561|nr:hypothetical protein [Myxococcus dinghuensis]MCP3097290.1 hypothetical protein [Myxococcus dinghuensis]
MGWWTVDGSTDELGDGPADVIESQLDLFVMGTPKLSFQYFLDSAAAALREVGALVVSDPASLEKVRLRARFASPAPELVSGEPTDTELQGTLSSALFRIMDEYEAGLGRMPRLSEVLGTFAFSLSGPSERFFSESKGLRLQGLVAERG